MNTIFSQPYAALVKLTKDAAREALAPMRAKEMHTQALARLASLDSQVFVATQKVVELGGTYPIDWDKLTAAMDEAALLRRRKEQLELIVAELFPIEVKIVSTTGPAAAPVAGDREA